MTLKFQVKKIARRNSNTKNGPRNSSPKKWRKNSNAKIVRNSNKKWLTINVKGKTALNISAYKIERVIQIKEITPKFQVKKIPTQKIA